VMDIQTDRQNCHYIFYNNMACSKKIPQLMPTATCPSANAAMTLPRADSDLLMFLASSSTDPSAPVLHTYINILSHFMLLIL